MATYVTLYQFTDRGIQNVKDSPSRARAAVEKGKEVGLEVVGLYYTQGPYDMVVVSRSDDEDAATAFALTTASQGNVRSTTMRAWGLEEFERIVGMMP